MDKKILSSKRNINHPILIILFKYISISDLVIIIKDYLSLSFCHKHDKFIDNLVPCLHCEIEKWYFSINLLCELKYFDDLKSLFISSENVSKDNTEFLLIAMDNKSDYLLEVLSQYFKNKNFCIKLIDGNLAIRNTAREIHYLDKFDMVLVHFGFSGYYKDLENFSLSLVNYNEEFNAIYI
jgi:hypothetical protein